RGEEMAAAVPVLRLLDINQAQIGFMDQSGCLKRQAGLFVGQSLGCQLAQLIVDQRQELLGSGWTALIDGLEDMGNVTHANLETLAGAAPPPLPAHLSWA